MPLIAIKFKRAELNKSINWISLMNPFVIFDYGKKTYCTKTANKQDKEPKWKEIIVFKEIKGDDEVKLYVKHRHASNPNESDEIGRCNLKLLLSDKKKKEIELNIKD